MTNSSGGKTKNYLLVYDDRKKGIFYAGETVSGTISFMMNAMEKYTGIILKIRGYSDVLFYETKQHLYNKQGYTGKYTAEEVYFETENNLLHPENEKPYIPFPGINKFAFAFVLPIDLPSSCKLAFGNVRYETEITVSRPYKNDSVHKEPFTVLSVISSDEIQRLLQPFYMTKTENYSFLTTAKGSCQIMVELAKTLFDCDEHIKLKCTIKNQTDIEVEKLEVILIQLVTAVAQIPWCETQMDRNKVKREFGDPVQKMSIAEQCFSIRLIPLPSSSFDNSRALTISYSLKVKARMKSTLHKNVCCEFPITIGNTADAVQSEIFTANHMIATNFLDQYQTAPSTSTAMNQLDLPSYDEVMKGDIKKRGLDK